MPASFVERFASPNSQDILPNSSDSRISGLVVSDTHIGAPYADPMMVEDFFAKELKGKKFCVLLGDIFEVVNLAVKDLPRTKEAARQERVNKVKHYANKLHISLSNAVLENLQTTNPDRLNKYFGEKPETLEELRTIFRKSRTQDDVIDEMIDRHMMQLEKLVRDNPGCTFHYVIGNHERFPAYLTMMKELSGSLEAELGEKRLQIVEDYVKIGDGLFVHGDQQMNPKKYHIRGHDKFKEAHTEMFRPLILQYFEDKLNKRIPGYVGEQLHRVEQCAYNILTWFNKHAPDVLDGVKHVFLGHTHYPYTNERIIDGLTNTFTQKIYRPHRDEVIRNHPFLVHTREYIFHNTGAALQRFKKHNKDTFNPLRITLTFDPDRHADKHDPHVFYGNSTISVEQIPQQHIQYA